MKIDFANSLRMFLSKKLCQQLNVANFLWLGFCIFTVSKKRKRNETYLVLINLGWLDQVVYGFGFHVNLKDNNKIIIMVIIHKFLIFDIFRPLPLPLLHLYLQTCCIFWPTFGCFPLHMFLLPKWLKWAFFEYIPKFRLTQKCRSRLDCVSTNFLGC